MHRKNSNFKRSEAIDSERSGEEIQTQRTKTAKVKRKARTVREQEVFKRGKRKTREKARIERERKQRGRERERGKRR